MSRRTRTEEEIDPFGCVLILVLLIILGVLLGNTIYEAIQVSKFDDRFSSGALNIESNFLALGSEGNPTATQLPEWVPDGDESITISPRIFDVSGCEGFTVPEETNGVYASTSFFQPELIVITVPTQSSGYVNVCVPQGTQIQVVLWARVGRG